MTASEDCLNVIGKMSTPQNQRPPFPYAPGMCYIYVYANSHLINFLFSLFLFLLPSFYSFHSSLLQCPVSCYLFFFFKKDIENSKMKEEKKKMMHFIDFIRHTFKNLSFIIPLRSIPSRSGPAI